LLDILDYEYTLMKPASSPRMTYILGSKCKDGVVLVADRKFSIEQGAGIDFIYDDKLFGEYNGIIMGFAGTRRRFELFKTYVMDFVKTSQGQNGGISIEKFILKASEIAASLVRCDFDVLLGISGDVSILKHMYGDGGRECKRICSDRNRRACWKILFEKVLERLYDYGTSCRTRISCYQNNRNLQCRR
jgi:hypothetical protein